MERNKVSGRLHTSREVRELLLNRNPREGVYYTLDEREPSPTSGFHFMQLWVNPDLQELEDLNGQEA